MTTSIHEERILPGNPVYPPHLARYQAAAAAIPASAAVLDAGCGGGYGAAVLAEVGHKVTAVDRAADAVASASSEYGDLVSFAIADVVSLPFGDASFDAVTCFEVIEHVESPAALVAELARVLRPGGMLYLSTPNARMEQLHARAAGLGDNPFHVAPLTPRRLRRLLRAHFEDVVLRGQSEERGSLHALQALDPLGLRLRLQPARREVMRRPLGTAACAAVVAEPHYRFSRLNAYSAAITFAEARRP